MTVIDLAWGARPRRPNDEHLATARRAPSSRAERRTAPAPRVRHGRSGDLGLRGRKGSKGHRVNGPLEQAG